MKKVYPSVEEAVADIPSGATIALGGFFTCGQPIALPRALAQRGVTDLTLIAMSLGVGNEQVDLLIANGQVKKVIANYPFYRTTAKGSQHISEILAREGQVAVEVYPMGTFAEKLRAGGAGIPAFYTPTGAGTLLAEGKETRIFDGREHVLETALKPDYAFVHAFKGDREGNLTYRKTARNNNPIIAMAARVTIAEVESLVEPGEIDPECVHTPGIFVQRLVEVGKHDQAPTAA